MHLEIWCTVIYIINYVFFFFILVHDTQSAQHAQSEEHNTYIVTSWRQYNAPILPITTMAALVWAHWIVLMTIYVLCSLLRACWALCVSWTNFCFNKYIYAPSLVLVEHSVGSNTNNAWTLPLAVHSRHVTTKPLWWWGGWAHWIVFMHDVTIYVLCSLLWACWALCVPWTNFCFN